MRRFLALILVLCLASSVLPGCASKYGTQKTVVQYYPACYRPVQDLRDRENDVAKGTAGGAVVGALGGALLGLLVSGGKWQGAVTGAATGAVAGAVTGNIYASKQKEADDNRRLASYLQDIDGDISHLDVQGAAARASLQCYDREFNVLLAQIRSKAISREAAARRYGEITSGREEAIAILGDVVASGRNLNQQYEEAFMQEERQIAASQTTDRTAYQQKTRALRQARDRGRTLSQKTVAFEEEKTSAQSASIKYNKEMNEAMAELDDIRA